MYLTATLIPRILDEIIKQDDNDISNEFKQFCIHFDLNYHDPTLFHRVRICFFFLISIYYLIVCLFLLLLLFFFSLGFPNSCQLLQIYFMFNTYDY